MSNPSFFVINEDANEPARDDEEGRVAHAQLSVQGVPVVGDGPPTSRRRRRSRRVFGSVERLPSGRFRARVVGPDGKYLSAPTTFTSRTDASLWVDVQHADLVRGAWKAPLKRSASPSVSAYVEQWIVEHPNARESTKELYRGLLQTCITPTLGRAGVGSLTAASVRLWHHQLGERLAADAEHRRAALAARGRTGSVASVRDGATRQAQAYRLPGAAMSTAVTDGLLASNPCTIRGTATPRRAVGRSRPVAERLLSSVQVADAAATMPPRYRVLVLMAAWSGLRQGELLALTRADVDLDEKPARVMVRKAVRRADSGQVRVAVPKTASSVRAVVLPDPLAVALGEHLEQFVSVEPAALVFSTGTGTTPARSNLGATWRRACFKAGVPQVRLHDLRHVAQVFAAEAGATLPELMARLGHATPAAAMVYLHARSGRDAQLTAALAQRMIGE
ncbi:MAG: site-specific integrase [Actinomycetia bacterium]|nr:site-specific integrase [Actinomycetes bacterium]